MSTWVVSPCHRGRLDELRDMLWSLDHDPANVVVVTTMPDPIEGDDLVGLADHVVVFEKPGLLFGEWFNLGFDYIAARTLGGEPHEVLCIGSSLLGDSETIPRLRSALRDHNLSMVGPDMFGRVEPGQVDIQRDGDRRTLQNRVLANCFMVAGELGLRFDPQFRWWFSDDSFEMDHRKVGPVGNVGGVRCVMTHADGHYLSEEQARWAVEDRVKFVVKYGCEPW